MLLILVSVFVASKRYTKYTNVNEINFVFFDKLVGGLLKVFFNSMVSLTAQCFNRYSQFLIWLKKEQTFLSFEMSDQFYRF